MKRKILSFNDNLFCHKLTNRNLSEDYEVIPISVVKQAEDVLKEDADNVYAIFIYTNDVNDEAFSLFSYIKGDDRMEQVPIIVFYDQVDISFIQKMYDQGVMECIACDTDPGIVTHKIMNAIKYRELYYLSEAADMDTLTGLYRRRTFLRKAGEMIAEHEPGYYVISCFDIERFKIINDLYGTEQGDELLKSIADIMKHSFSKLGGICCRITADNFAVIYPIKYMDERENAEIYDAITNPHGVIQHISLSIGRYIVNDLSLQIRAMYDRAVMAKATVKGRYDVHIAIYDESMRERILSEQEIVNEMKTALAEEQFEVWYQPQFNHENRAMIGAEALVRWRHPEKGLISPGVFIPIFEKNGFVYEVDKYVWRHACAFLRELLDEGIVPTPISVNISRYDVFRDDLVDTVVDIVNKYHLPHDMLRLEITESAFAKSSEQIIKVVEAFRKNGFTMEIDDFGSGYSSLNTLKDVPADVLKLDMKFLEGEKNSDKGGNIVASIIRMAKWIGICVIAEGVETIEQADFLKSIGCSHIQGYLYSKPLPQVDYKQLLQTDILKEKMLALVKVETYDVGAFWNPSSLDTLIFNSYVGAACIFEHYDNKITLLRVNGDYVKLMGGPECSESDLLDMELYKYVNPSDHKTTMKLLKDNLQSNTAFMNQMEFGPLGERKKPLYVRAMMRVIARTGQRSLIYCLLEDVTQQIEAEFAQKELTEKLQTILENVSGSISVMSIGEDSKFHVEFANENYFKQRGYTRKQFMKEVSEPSQLIHPDDVNRLNTETTISAKTQRPMSTIYRIIRRDGTTRWCRSRVTYAMMESSNMPIQINFSEDITKEKVSEKKEREMGEQLQMVMDHVGCGVCASVVRNCRNEIIIANSTYYKQRGYTKETFEKEVQDTYELVFGEERNHLDQCISNVKADGKTEILEYRIRLKDGTIRWIRNSICWTNFVHKGEPVLLSIFVDITDEKEGLQRIRDLEQKVEQLSNDKPHKAGEE